MLIGDRDGLRCGLYFTYYGMDINYFGPGTLVVVFAVDGSHVIPHHLYHTHHTVDLPFTEVGTIGS
jgi:hypothetical protein